MDAVRGESKKEEDSNDRSEIIELENGSKYETTMTPTHIVSARSYNSMKVLRLTDTHSVDRANQ